MNVILISTENIHKVLPIKPVSGLRKRHLQTNRRHLDDSFHLYIQPVFVPDKLSLILSVYNRAQ